MNIVVVGSINVDYSSITKNLPKKGETVLATDYYVSPGGKGANQAVAAARLGANVSMIGKVGNDANGKMMIGVLEKEGINIEGISTADISTGSAQIALQSDGSNTIIVYPGANYCLSINDINMNRSLLKNADIIILQLEIPMEIVNFVLTIAHENEVEVILNPAPARKLDESMYRKIPILTPNETELEFLTGESDVLSGAKKLIDIGISKVVVTLGEKGCIYVDENRSICVDAFNVEVVDTTAAGDAFNAALAVALSKDNDINDALVFANKVGALATTIRGAIPSLPYISQIYE